VEHSEHFSGLFGDQTHANLDVTARTGLSQVVGFRRPLLLDLSSESVAKCKELASELI
jgi:hypothetical protein